MVDKSSVGVNLDYFGYYLYLEEKQEIVKIAEISPKASTKTQINESKVKKELKEYFLGKIDEDEHELRQWKEF
jgi:hypothetical protein